jgi:glycine/D-amino acid oxidase-like deaminating enzyme
MGGNIMETKKNVLIIGGGIFGLTSAIVLAEKGYKVTVVEKRNDIMQEASMVNQNRVHFGYHYPRSKATCEESLLGLESFKEFYGEAIYSDFKKYYAIAKSGSHVSANDFYSIFMSLGLTLVEEWPEEGVLDRSMVEACWLTPETIFDFNKLKQIAFYRCHANRNIRVIRNTHPVSISEINGYKEVVLTNGYKINCEVIVNAAYSGISDIVHLLGVERVKAKFQLCVMPILEMENAPEQKFGVTVMDGPFCSLMPKGFNKNHFILYHVTHSVVQQHVGYHSVDWSPIDGFVELDIIELSKVYYPILEKMKLRDTWITTRIVLPDQEMDDARPTLLINHENDIYTTFSGKLTTCVDVARKLLVELEKF